MSLHGGEEQARLVTLGRVAADAAVDGTID
jgi:hypothetical protein